VVVVCDAVMRVQGARKARRFARRRRGCIRNRSTWQLLVIVSRINVRQTASYRQLRVALYDAGLQGRLKPGQHFLYIFVGGGSDLTSRELPPVHCRNAEQIVASSRKSHQTSSNSPHAGGNSCRYSGNSGSGAHHKNLITDGKQRIPVRLLKIVPITDSTTRCRTCARRLRRWQSEKVSQMNSLNIRLAAQTAERT
jgi:hypothetical protein